MPEENKEDEEPDFAKNYKPAARVSVAQLSKKDADDKALNKMKDQLLGKNTDTVFDDKLGTVIFDSLTIKPSGRDNIVIKAADLKKGQTAFSLKEGCEYLISIQFRVQKEIVMALKFSNTVKFGPLNVPNEYTVGSFAPGKEYDHTFKDTETAPSGMLKRGVYKAKVKLYDDDTGKDKPHAEYDYSFKIAKKW